MDTPRILFIDSYDSFTNNLAALCRQAAPECQIHIIKNDSRNIQELSPYLSYFSAIVVGPGPGTPSNANDIGAIKDIWKLPHDKLLPVLGVCLGLQSLAMEFGGTVQRLSAVKHGQISRIQHTGVDLFTNVEDVEAVRYHSLHVTVQDNRELEELAWANDQENGRVIMALKHKSKPFWAVQYHPESVRTSGGGLEVMKNFCKLADTWNHGAGRRILSWDQNVEAFFGPSWPQSCLTQPPTKARQQPQVSPVLKPRKVITEALILPRLTSISVAELFRATNEQEPFVLLDASAQPGKHSIIGVPSPTSIRLQYHNGDNHVTLYENGRPSRRSLNSDDIWTWVSRLMKKFLATGGNTSIPFWGGLVGYISYELACNTVEPNPSRSHHTEHQRTHPDINLILIERSVVLENGTGNIFVQSIIPEDDTWVGSTVSSLRNLANRPTSASTSRPPTSSPSSCPTLHLPSKASYISKINMAKEHLAAGNSYELCLTAESRITLLPATDKRCADATVSTSWERFKTLRKRNPAPYSAYLRLHPSTVLSSSPERFLSISRSPESLCQLRPIKGTLRKSSCIKRVDAENALQGSAKEVAENLMIVDLIRHDLHGVIGEDVKVTQFCGVEEYETVWQMVSVIEGKPHPTHADNGHDHGWNVLRQCLPPGSMTGAPKKRSVEILRELEDTPRGIYSGVLGYWDVGGGGDWSVIIRSCFKYDESSEYARSTTGTFSGSSNGSIHSDTDGSDNLDESGNGSDYTSSTLSPDLPKEKMEEWMIGAGGAITALSDPEAEWEEMLVKLQSTFGAFGLSAREKDSMPMVPILRSDRKTD